MPVPTLHFIGRFGTKNFQAGPQHRLRGDDKTETRPTKLQIIRPNEPQLRHFFTLVPVRMEGGGEIVEVECHPVWLPMPRRRLQDTRPIGHDADQATFAFVAEKQKVR